MKPTILKKVSLAVVKDGKLLMARSHKNADVYYTPGGKIEESETELDALIREIREELGTEIQIDTIRFLHEFEDAAHGRENTRVNIKMYSGELAGEPSPSGEIAELMYFDSSVDPARLTPTGIKIFSWLKENNYID